MRVQEIHEPRHDEGREQCINAGRHRHFFRCSIGADRHCQGAHAGGPDADEQLAVGPAAARQRVDESARGRGSDRPEDQGHGAGEPRRPQSLGLVDLRERARLLGGELTVASPPGGGTRIEARLPLPEGEP